MQSADKIGTLVLIDDDELDHILNKRVIGQSGLVDDVISFYYAEEALQFLQNPQRPPVDLVALDINMPRMNGFDFLDAVIHSQQKKSFPEIKVVMLTTSISPADKKKALSYELVKDYIYKPLTPQNLREMLKVVNP